MEMNSIVILKDGRRYYVTFTDLSEYPPESLLSDEYTSFSILREAIEVWEDFARLAEQHGYEIDIYVSQHKEEFIELFNKAKVKVML